MTSKWYVFNETIYDAWVEEDESGLHAYFPGTKRAMKAGTVFYDTFKEAHDALRQAIQARLNWITAEQIRLTRLLEATDQVPLNETKIVQRHLLEMLEAT